MTPKKIIVTSGGTREYIDEVRVLTNISTGRLGSQIAFDLETRLGYSVEYIHGVGAAMPSDVIHGKQFITGINNHQVSTAWELEFFLRQLLTTQDIYAVVHAMAVSDFTFTRSEAVKCKSDSPEDFIEYMRRTITKNPKIISHIKEWAPKVFLIGFKFEVGASLETLRDLAQKSMEKNGCDVIMANDKIEMMTQKVHVGHFFFSKEMLAKGFQDREIRGKFDIAQEIGNIITQVRTREDILDRSLICPILF